MMTPQLLPQQPQGTLDLPKALAMHNQNRNMLLPSLTGTGFSPAQALFNARESQLTRIQQQAEELQQRKLEAYSARRLEPNAYHSPLQPYQYGAPMQQPYLHAAPMSVAAPMQQPHLHAAPMSVAAPMQQPQQQPQYQMMQQPQLPVYAQQPEPKYVPVTSEFGRPAAAESGLLSGGFTGLNTSAFGPQVDISKFITNSARGLPKTYSEQMKSGTS